MREQGSEYEFDPATDGTRLERVHALITACPDEFAEAIEELEDYTADRVIKYVRQARAEDRELLVEPPETLAGQFELYLDTLSYRLAGLTPNPGWGWASDVLLAYWIMCCDQAEKAERITRFQDWTWEVTAGQGVSRRQFHLGPTGSFWRRFSAAVDKALALAEARGLIAGVSKRAEADLGESERKVLAALRGARRSDTRLLGKDIGAANGLSEDAVNRAVAKLRDLGWTISNPRGSRGYGLDREPIS